MTLNGVFPRREREKHKYVAMALYDIKTRIAKRFT